MRTRVVTASSIGLAVVALSLGAAPGASAATACADIDATPAAIGIDRAAAAVSCLVDHERTAAGLTTLAIDPRVRSAAQLFAVDMVTRRFFSHDSPDGTDPGDRIKAAGFAWSAYGENIASGQRTAREVMSAWLASEGHCENLMTPYFTVAGYGIATASDGPYWVQDFSRPLAAGVGAVTLKAPSCPRAPAAFGTVASAAPTTTAPGTPATMPSTVTAASVRRVGRRLRIRIALPGANATLKVVVRVRQSGRTIRRSVLRRPAGTTQKLTVTLRRAGGGRLLVRAGTGATVGVTFR
ncbi:CAP domain-containing protein [Patulibacter sp. NPDC049589]|uniref:CAP domain-containing protein n=1 Tax=Patulibacter sp. NPDC049589 TaxID=3154731 RepID=UPI00341939D1